MKQEHTTGPWGISSETPTIIKTFDAFGETSIIIGSASGYEDSPFFPSDEKAEANARLMAAAPQLLEALVELERQAALSLDYRPEFRRAIADAHAAIAKATGSAA